MAFCSQFWGPLKHSGAPQDEVTKSPFLTPVHPKRFTVGVQDEVGDTRLLRTPPRLQWGSWHPSTGGWGAPNTAPPIPKGEESPRDGQSPRRGQEQGTVGASTEISAHHCNECVHSLPYPRGGSSPSVHGQSSHGGSLSPPEGSVQLSCTVPHRGPRCVSLTRDRTLPRVPAEGTGTRGDTATPSVLQEVDEAGWEDTGAGAVTLDEANLGVPKGGSEVPFWAAEKL